MRAFPDWHRFVVPQRRPLSGCIPAGYEMLLRAAGIPGIDFETFQNDFDLDKDLKVGDPPRNNFDSVSEVIHKKYPYVHFKRVVFLKGEGDKKLQFVVDSVNHHRLVLISLNMLPIVHRAGWHVMPVVDLDDLHLYLIYAVQEDGNAQVMKLPKQKFIRIHEQFDGGDDLAYLEEQRRSEFDQPKTERP